MKLRLTLKEVRNKVQEQLNVEGKLEYPDGCTQASFNSTWHLGAFDDCYLEFELVGTPTVDKDSKPVGKKKDTPPNLKKGAKPTSNMKKFIDKYGGKK